MLLWAACANLQAQFPRALTEGMRLSNQISSALELELDVQRQVLEVALHGDACLAHWRAHQDSAEASTMPEGELLKVLTRCARKPHGAGLNDKTTSNISQTA